ncbi:MAG: tetratricopeptide repeat protein [Paracoccaceae bacterium]|jgi:TPR repeat protein
MKHLVIILFVFLSLGTSLSASNEIFLERLEALAEQGDLAAQVELANAYRKGIRVTQDYKTAVKWFTLAAEQGHAVAQYNLGIMHSFGLGVVPNYKHAVKWYTLAAEQGDPLAQYNLGRLYYLGKGVSENLIYAHMWAKHASLNGFAMGTELKDLLTELMTENQLSEAHRLGKECEIKKYKGC